MTPDVNVLVAADRGEHPHHASALNWLREGVATATSDAPLTLLPRALGNVAWLLAAPHVRWADLGGEWPAFAELCEHHRLAGPVASDA